MLGHPITRYRGFDRPGGDEHFAGARCHFLARDIQPLMRALMLQPKVLLLDEPLGALDPMVRARLQDDLKEVFERLQQTTVLVTHDMAEAGFFANLIVLLNEGRIVQSGTLDDLRNRPASTFVRDFLHAQRGLAAI